MANLKFKLFLASPSDVKTEREAVHNIVKRVVRNYNRRKSTTTRVSVEVIAWDKKRYLQPADTTPQGNIISKLGSPSTSDIVVVIFWQRFGTPIDAKYGTNPQGRPMTGTEYEFYDALRAEGPKKPILYVYRCTSKKTPQEATDAELAEIQKQRSQVDGFFRREFMGKNGYKREFHPYDSAEQFTQLFTEHFRIILDNLVSQQEQNERQDERATESNPKPSREPAKVGSSGGRPSQSGVLAAGKKVGAYELRVELGQGGNGVVWRAHDSMLGRDVAIKFLYQTDEKRKKRFSQEMKKLANLDHPHILRIYTSGSYKGMPYMVLPYIPGTDLSKRINEGSPPSPEQIVEWLEQIASALDYCHLAGIVHRDVKPHNVLIERKTTRQGQEEVLLLADFGLAWEGDASDPRMSSDGEKVGTSGYMAPEQTLGKPPHKSMDLYALGIMAYEMLTGELPFLHYDASGRLDGDRIRQAHREDPLPQRSLSKEVFQVLQRATQKNQDERYESAEAFVSALKLALFSKSEAKDVNIETVGTQTRTQAMKKIDSPNPYERALAYDLLGKDHEDHRPGLRLTDLSWSETIQPGTYAVGGDASAVEPLSVRLRRIELPYPFAMSSFLVTNEQFSAFEEADRQASQTGNPRPWWLGLPAQEANMTKPTTALYNYPRDKVSYRQGLAFCRWLTQWMRERGDLENNEVVDLPSDFEWEIATRCEGKLYPWGHITFADVYYPSYANVDETDEGRREGFRLGRSCAVGIYENDRTHNGIYDVCGNLLQWCHACNAPGGMQSLRGAPWSSKPRSLASRLLKQPDLKNGIIGLRLVRRPADAPFNELTMKD